jgi:hypothetical protein
VQLDLQLQAPCDLCLPSHVVLHGNLEAMLGTLKGKPLIFGLAAFLLLVLFFVGLSKKDYVPSFTTKEPLRPTSGAWEFVTERDERNLGLSEEQCQVSCVHPH